MDATIGLRHCQGLHHRHTRSARVGAAARELGEIAWEHLTARSPWSPARAAASARRWPWATRGRARRCARRAHDRRPGARREGLPGRGCSPRRGPRDRRVGRGRRAGTGAGGSRSPRQPRRLRRERGDVVRHAHRQALHRPAVVRPRHRRDHVQGQRHRLLAVHEVRAAGYARGWQLHLHRVRDRSDRARGLRRLRRHQVDHRRVHDDRRRRDGREGCAGQRADPGRHGRHPAVRPEQDARVPADLPVSTTDTNVIVPAAVWLASDDSADVTGIQLVAKEFNSTGPEGVRAAMSEAGTTPMPTAGTV